MNNIDSLDHRTSYPGSASAQSKSNAATSSFESKLQLAKGSAKPDPARELQEWLAMTPDQRLFFTVLHSMGVSKEQYEQMSPEEKEKLAEKVRERIKEMAKNGTAGTA